jgi:diguanylate cyclase (GGDEF)-like protein/PAS domain S-box-containing protein
MLVMAQLSDVIDGVSTGLLVWSLLGLYQDMGHAVSRRSRWLAGVALAVAGTRSGLALAWIFGAQFLPASSRLLVACTLLIVAMSVSVARFHVSRGRISRLNDVRIGEMEQITRSRLIYAEAQGAQAREWLLMSEQISHVGHWRIGLPANELFWSEEVYRIFGVSPETYTPEIDSAMAFKHPDDREAGRTSIARTLAERVDYHWEGRLIRPGGEIRYAVEQGVPQFSTSGEMIGVFGVISDITDQKLIEDELRLANQAAAQVNLELNELALMDSLSGLPNRRHFDVAMEREFKRAHRDNRALALAMIDLDFFKSYNDAYGHLGGDDCLRRVAGVIAEALRRPADQAARYGGEEFAVLLPDTDEEGAIVIAERMVAAVRALRLAHRENPVGHVTISCGVAVAWPRQDRATAHQLIGRADGALYDAKRSGRDRVCHCGGEPTGGADEEAEASNVQMLFSQKAPAGRG